MKRKIYNDLLHWKNTEHGRVALLIDGARRVGKSYIVKEFAQNKYKSHIFSNRGQVRYRLYAFFVEEIKQQI